MKNTNVLLLTVDALRRDRLGFSGYKRNTSPNIDKLTQQAIWCDNSFSLAPSTQPSIPTIITSTQPLSYGGYDMGIKYRPNSLTEILKKQQYKTRNLITFPWLRGTYGYDVGFDNVDHLYNITGIVGATIHTIRSFSLAYMAKEMTIQEMLEKTSPLIFQCFNDIEIYCQSQVTQLQKQRRHFSHSFFSIQDYDYKSVIQTVQKHRDEFKSDQALYINKRIVNLPQQASYSWISKDIKYKRKLTKKIGLFSDNLISLILYIFSPKNSLLYRFKNKIYVDASELTDYLIDHIKLYAKSDRKSPFYMWTHFLDTHMPYCPGELPNWPKNAKKYLRATGHSDKVDLSRVCQKSPSGQMDREIWNAAYDSCVNYTDEQIGRILNVLDDTGLRDSTLVVIAGDHGEEIGEHGEYGHRFRFYDECINVPMIFHMPSFKEHKITGLADLSDLAPTILGILNIDKPDSYIGNDLSSMSEGKDFIQLEAFHRGNCLFKYKPLYMAIRTNDYKYIWKEWRDQEDLTHTDIIELFDLKSDPKELLNIAGKHPEIVANMQEFIAKRLVELPDYYNNRTLKSLVKNGVQKYLS